MKRVVVRNPFLLCWLMIACAARICAAEGNAIDLSAGTMRGRIERFSTDYQTLQRRYNVALAESRPARLQQFFEDQLRELQSVNFDALSQSERVDYVLLQSRLKFELSELAHERSRLKEAAQWMPFAPPLVRLLEARLDRQPGEASDAAKTLASAAEQVIAARKELDKKAGGDKKDSTNGAPSKVVANRTANLVEDLRKDLGEWNGFFSGYNPEFTWWTDQPFRKVDKELKDYVSLLRKKIAGQTDEEDEPLIGDPIGREALIEALRAEMIPYSPEELIEIANKEFEWCEKEQRRAAHDLGFGDDWKKALDHVSNQHVKPGEQPALIKQIADESVKFLEDRDLVTIPPLCKEAWRMEMMSPERQKVTPYFTGGEVISVSYPTATMTYDDKLMSMRGNNIPFSRATVHHELIPGHHLQGFMSSRFQTHRRVFRTPFLVEGWALYWEMLLWDLNFPQTPEDRVGMLFWRSHRCARIIFSLKFHLGQMSAQECVDFLVDRVGHERRNATAEVRRSINGSYGPTYQAAYMLGGLQIRALHRELVDSKKMTNREFHDAILRENAIPIEMIRADLLKLPLTRDYAPNWRFYDAVK